MQCEEFADGGAQVVDAQVDGAQLAKALESLHRGLVHVAGTDGRHHGQRIQAGGDHPAVQAVVAEVADQLVLHVDARAHRVGLERGDLQAEHGVEDDHLFEDLLQAGFELGLESLGQGGVGFAHKPHCRAARSFMISSAPPPIIITLTSRYRRSLTVPRMKPMPPRICTAWSAQNCMVWVLWFFSRHTWATQSAPVSPPSARAASCSSQAAVEWMRICMSTSLWRITWRSTRAAPKVLRCRAQARASS